MKKLALICLSLSCLLAGCLTGCSTLGPDGPYAGDKFLYETDLAITTGYTVLDRFVTWEWENRAALASTPAIRGAADYVRANGPAWVTSAINLREVYAAVPNTENKDALRKALAALRTGVMEATKYLAAHGQISTAKPEQD